MPTLTIQDALAAALAHHQANRLAEAEALYRQVLAVDPRQLDALNLLGVACHQLGRSQQGAEFLHEALRLRPEFAEARYNLGNIHRDCRRLEEAATCYAQAVRLKPDYAEAHYNLGNALLELKQFALAVESYEQALQAKPNYAKALNNLGNARMELRQPAEAAACYERILQLNPRYPKGHTNLGRALCELGQTDRAVEHCQLAIQLEPDNAEAHNNLGAAYMDQVRIDEALACYEQALRVRPHYAEARMNRAMAWLLLGDYERGWPEYEARWQSKAFSPRMFPHPMWNGEPLDGRTLLLHAEQGMGDTLHFVRYAAAAKTLGGTVLLECQPALHPLLSSVAGIDSLVSSNLPPPPFDVHAPLLSLPWLLKQPHPDPRQPPYLSPHPAWREQWQGRLVGEGGFRVGINWQGNPDHPRDKLRSVALSRFLPLADVPGVRLVSLQKGHGCEQLAALPAAQFARIWDLGASLDNASGAFVETAAVLSLLDLLITTDTAVAHLAGGLGVPVWLVLAACPDWRWQLQREDTPWYPSMRLFRQPTPGDWDDVFKRVIQELQKAVNRTHPLDASE